ncbi:vanadium-dependent haloperoxidase [Merismopedia glauca]|nr:vanadium-dependent haloperoxidase [Merismopedia glauca]
MSINNINDLALELVAKDFSDGHASKANNGGPTKTSRALAIIHLAAHDAYAIVTKQFAPKLESIPNPPATLDNMPTTGSAALLGAGFRAATLLYPDFEEFIATEAAKISDPSNLAYKYGELVAEAWVAARTNDGSQAPQLDSLYNQAPGRHRPDPLDPQQQTLGRNWGLVTPFVISSVISDAFLGKQPELNSAEYATAFNEVMKDGKNDIINREPPKGVIGIFWGYDGANKLGTPPRLYNQVVRAIAEFKALPHERQIRVLTAINVAMADAGIAAWYWKYQYDFWRPVLGIREADAGWGPTGNGDGNGGTTVDPFWLPLGAPNSNPINKPASNGTPPFPAYPSGHATFGAACFMTAAALLGKSLDDISVDFVSDEFNGVTTDNTGVVRPKYKASFTLRKAIEDNNISRIYLGVHWIFDATGGETVGTAIANKVCVAFQ